MKYEKGDKFIIEIDKVIPYGNDQNIYLIKAGDSSLGVLTQQTLDKLEHAQEHDGCDGCEHVPVSTLNLYPCNECKQNYKDKWTPKTEEIQVGDEVRNEVVGCKGVVWQIKGKNMRIMRKNNGELETSWWIKEVCTRTGKTYPELVKALEELPKEGE